MLYTNHRAISLFFRVGEISVVPCEMLCLSSLDKKRQSTTDCNNRKGVWAINFAEGDFVLRGVLQKERGHQSCAGLDLFVLWNQVLKFILRYHY